MTTELITIIVAVAAVVVGLALGLAWWMNHTPNVRRNVDGRLPLFGSEYDPDHPRAPLPRATPPAANTAISPEARAIRAERAAAYGAPAERRPEAPTTTDAADVRTGKLAENADATARSRAAAKAAIRDLDLAGLEASLSLEQEPNASPAGSTNVAQDSSATNVPPDLGHTELGKSKRSFERPSERSGGEAKSSSSSILEFKTSHRSASRGHAPTSPLPVDPAVPASPVAPASPTPTPAPAAASAANSAVVSTAGVPGTMVEGQLLRFSVPAEGTLQFLPGRLEIAAGFDAGREIRFVNVPGPDGTIVTFGRSEGELYRHIQLRDQTVSRAHARMRLMDARWHLLNLSQTNPVVHNGRVLANGEERPLDDGDRIEMGEVLFTFRSR